MESSPNNSEFNANFKSLPITVVLRTVYFRRADGKGTVTWGRGYPSDILAIKARDECYERVPDASLVWAHRSGQSGALGAVLQRHIAQYLGRVPR